MSKSRSFVGSFIALALAISPLAIYSANAATGGPRDSYISLQSPILDASNTSDAIENQKMADGWVANGWFGTGLVFQRAFVPVGSTVTLVYHVTDKDGKILVGQDVKLRINKG